jgi:hypothetical protein
MTTSSKRNRSCMTSTGWVPSAGDLFNNRVPGTSQIRRSPWLVLATIYCYLFGAQPKLSSSSSPARGRFRVGPGPPARVGPRPGPAAAGPSHGALSATRQYRDRDRRVPAEVTRRAVTVTGGRCRVRTALRLSDSSLPVRMRPGRRKSKETGHWQKRARASGRVMEPWSLPRW